MVAYSVLLPVRHTDWGLRDYGTAKWEGGDPECKHNPQRPDGGERSDRTLPLGRGGLYRSTCGKCGAIRIDNQLGLERTPEEYIANMVAVFRECWRVLRDDGTLWLNCGDSYYNYRGANNRRSDKDLSRRTTLEKDHHNIDGRPNEMKIDGLKGKDLVGIPWRLAFALQQPYQVPTCVKSEIDKAWLAAIFDGEGSIGIRRFSSYRKELQQVYQDGFVIYTSVTNNDTELLERCIEVTGYGKATLKQSADSTDKRGIVSRRDSFGWRLDGNKAVDVIRSIYPYLIIKRKQACIAYTLDDLNKNGHGSRAVPKEIQDKKAYLKELAHRCNQREKIDLPDWIKEPKPEIQPGWYLRSDVIWNKPNPMPESVTDRPTKSHEYLFLLAKQERYYYDQEAIREDKAESTTNDDRDSSNGHRRNRDYPGSASNGGTNLGGSEGGRNRRTVWTIPTAPYKGAHFATFPPALVEPCIKAGTSERGACPKCGKGWRRVIDRTPPGRHKSEYQTIASGRGNGGDKSKHATPSVNNTLGWRPDCKHYGLEIIKDQPTEPHPKIHESAKEFEARYNKWKIILNEWREDWERLKRQYYEQIAMPALVFDPFVGSGTTIKVAHDLGRRGIGLDLSLEYLHKQARKRIPIVIKRRLF